MKNLDHKLAGLLFLSCIFCFLFSCCNFESGKKIKKEEIPKREELEKIPITLNLLDEWVSPRLLNGAQVLSGNDSTGFNPIKSSTTQLGSGGKILFIEIPVKLVIPNTLGVVIPNGVIFDEKTQKVKQLNVTFWSDNRLFVPFGPSSDDLGTFTLLTLVAGQKVSGEVIPKEGLWVSIGGNLYEVTSGRENPLFLIPEWIKGTPDIAPGRKIGDQSTVQKPNPVPPYKKKNGYP